MTEIGRNAPMYERIVIDDDLELLALDVDSAKALFDAMDSSREYLAKYLPWVNDTNTVEFYRVNSGEKGQRRRIRIWHHFERSSGGAH